MSRSDSEHSGTSFSLGIVTGAVVGTAVGVSLVMWLSPRVRSELRERFGASAETLGRRASERYQRAAIRVGDAAGVLATKGEAVRNDLADALARGAHEVERLATSAKNSRPAGAS